MPSNSRFSVIRTLPGADKVTGEYKDHSVEAGDGIMYDVDPHVWGSHFWASIHLTAYAYPDEPSDETKQAVFNQFDSYRYALPCGACREHYRDNLKQYPVEEYLDSRDSLIQWTILMHSKVNESLEQPEFEFQTYLNKLTGEDAVVFSTDDEISESSAAIDNQEMEKDVQAEENTKKYSKRVSHDENESANDDSNQQQPSPFLSARSPAVIHASAPRHNRVRSAPAGVTRPVRRHQNLPIAQQDKHSSAQLFSDSNRSVSEFSSNNFGNNSTAVRHAHRLQQQMQRRNAAAEQKTAVSSRSRTKSPPPPGSRLAALMRARNRNRESNTSKSLTPSSFSRSSITAASRRQAESLRNAKFKRPTNECENCTKSVMTPSSF